MSKSNTPTPHNGAKLGDIAPTVLMPGDPLRAKYIAETYLDDVVQYNHVRGMNGYTGYYKGKRVSVQGHGMGIPSIGIYTYELYEFYDVERIIRVGSAGALQSNMKIGDIVIAVGACTDSAYGNQYGLPGIFAPIANYNLVEKAVAAARQTDSPVHVGNVLSSDMFYNANTNALKQWREMGVLAVEMEAAGLYYNSAKLGKEAVCITTISDCPFTGEATTAQERQTGFDRMIKIALEMVD